MTRDHLIETMARAIHDEYHQGGQTWDEAHAAERIMCRSMVAAALTAIEAAGMRVVPVVCETCRDDPAVCAAIPGLRHCDAAQEDSTSE